MGVHTTPAVTCRCSTQIVGQGGGSGLDQRVSTAPGGAWVNFPNEARMREVPHEALCLFTVVITTIENGIENLPY